MNLVIDASAFIALLVDVDEPTSLAQAELIAPELIIPEVLNVRRRLLRARLKPPQLDDFFGLLRRIEIVSMVALAREAVDASERLDHSLYDCFYVALALQRQALLATRDQRLSQKLSAAGLTSILAR